MKYGFKKYLNLYFKKHKIHYCTRIRQNETSEVKMCKSVMCLELLVNVYIDDKKSNCYYIYHQVPIKVQTIKEHACFN